MDLCYREKRVKMKYLTAVHTDAGVGKCTNQDYVLMETADTEYGQVLLLSLIHI